MHLALNYHCYLIIDILLYASMEVKVEKEKFLQFKTPLFLLLHYCYRGRHNSITKRPVETLQVFYETDL